MSDEGARDTFFADLDRLRSAARSPEFQIIAQDTGIPKTTIHGWFSTEPAGRRGVPRKRGKLITLVTYLLRRSKKLAPQESLDWRTQEDWFRRQRAAAADTTTPRKLPEVASSVGDNGNLDERGKGATLGWGGVAAVLNVGTELPRVSELDAYRLGAAPTRFGSVGHSGELDPYVARTADDVDARITGALTESAIVLVIGWSMVGKTRTLFEAIRRELPDARVLAPERTVLHAIPTHPLYTGSNDTIVVWLDDLDEYLQTEQKLTPTWLTHMRAAHPGRTVVVATMRREAFDRLETDSGEPTKDIRALLNHATQIPLESTSGSHIEHVAAETDYPNQGLEQYRALGYGLGEVLAGAPALLDRYRRADPQLRAVIEVAIDWYRIGRLDPIPELILIQLAALRARTLRSSLGLDTTAIAKSILTAREPVEATARIAALHTLWSSETDCGYRAFDYLVAADDGQHGGRQRPIPESFWDTATHDVGPDILRFVGLVASVRGYERQALRITKRAAETGDKDAMNHLGNLLHERGELDESEYWWRGAADTDTDAMTGVGILLYERGEFDEARTWWRRAAAIGDVKAIHNLGRLFSEQSEPAEAETWWRRAAEAGNTSAMNLLAAVLHGRGKLDESESWWHRAADSGDTEAIYVIGLLLNDRGCVDEAEDRWHRSAEAGNTDAMNTLGIVLYKRGEVGEAESWWHRSAEIGDTAAMNYLGNLLRERGELDEAERWLSRVASAGS